MPTETTERTKLYLDLAPQAYNLLQKLTERSGKDIADVLKAGLVYYDIAQEAKQQGYSLGVVDTKQNRIINEIVED